MSLHVLPYFVFRRLNLVLQQSTDNRIKVANNAKHARTSGALHLSVGDEKHEHLCLLVVEAVELMDAVHKTRVGVAHASIDVGNEQTDVVSSLVGTRRYLALKTLLVYLHYPFLVLADSRATYEGVSIHLFLQPAA